MNLTELLARLRAAPDLPLALALPEGRRVPAHFHITEVGLVTKKFVDCGGTFRTSEACVLQAHAGSTRDDGHRLPAGKLARIIGLAAPVLGASDLPVEVEYEAGALSQFPLAGMDVEAGHLVLRLGHKHTDCLAKDRCGLDGTAEDGGCGPVEGGQPAGCCGGSPAAAGCC